MKKLFYFGVGLSFSLFHFNTIVLAKDTVLILIPKANNNLNFAYHRQV